jgi:hypothetical protein
MRNGPLRTLADEVLQRFCMDESKESGEGDDGESEVLVLDYGERYQARQAEQTHCASESGSSSPGEEIPSCTFACPTKHGRIEAPDAELYSTPTAYTASSNLNGIVICRTESSRSTAIRLGTATSIRMLDVGGGRKEPGNLKEADDTEPRRELEFEVNPLVLGGWNGEQGLREECGRGR